jgi:hypothetical protein
MNKAKSLLLVVGISLLAFTALPAQSNAAGSIDIGIKIPIPPPLVFPAPPPVILIPDTYVYFVPDIDVDIFFYDGDWYRPYKGHWYRAHRYDDKWILLAPPLIPPVLLGLPPDHRERLRDRRRIPYEQLHRNWGWWKRDRYWDRHRDERDHRWRDRDRGPEWRRGPGGDYGRHDRRYGGYGGHMRNGPRGMDRGR